MDRYLTGQKGYTDETHQAFSEIQNMKKLLLFTVSVEELCVSGESLTSQTI